MTRRALVVLTVLALCVPLDAQTRAGGGAVAVEFFANGPDGVVFDLVPADVTLRVDGRPREIRSLRFVSLPHPDPAAGPAVPAVDLAPYGSNLPESAGRWVTIVLDHDSIRAGAEKEAMTAVARFVSALGPRDQVAMVKAPRGGVMVEYTTDHDEVVNALKRFVGSALRQEAEQDRSCRSRWMLNAVRDVLESLMPLEGPKLVAVVSSGLLNPRRDNPDNRAPGPCEIRLDDFQQVSVAASRSGAHLFVVQPDDVLMESAGGTVGRFASAQQDQGGLESLAGAASGEFIRIKSGDDDTLRTVARETSGYYVATFEPEASERNGQPRRLQVTVRRDGVRLRARPDVFIPRAPDTTAPKKTGDEMLRDRILYTALPLRVAAFTSLGAGGKVNVVTVLDSAEKGVKLTSAVFGLFDAKGQMAGKWTANSKQLAASPMLTAGEVAPGVYRLRVAAVDSTGRQGTVEYDVVARLVDASPLRLSGLVLGTTYDSRFTPKLMFGTDQSAAVLLETYGPAEGVTVRFDLMSAGDSRVLSTAAGTPAGGSGDRRTFIGTLRIAALAPGDYVVRAVVSVGGRPVGDVVRGLRKTPSGL